jgi:pyridoxine kinase
MAQILSMQSHVAFGYVGNRAAVFPLQRLGHEVTVINTVQFSNHTGYGSWTGDIMSLEHINKIFEGLEQRGALKDLNAVLTGYLGDAALGEILIKWLNLIKQHNPNVIYCCDPVMGDVGRGVFVKSGVPEFFKNQALSHAHILTPNQFELELLTGVQINNLEDAQKACRLLHEQGTEIVLVTSLTRADADPNTIEMLVHTTSEAYLIATPRLLMPMPINGSGDATTALFLGRYLETRDLKKSLELTAASIFEIFKATLDAKRRELALISAQAQLVEPEINFTAINYLRHPTGATTKQTF